MVWNINHLSIPNGQNEDVESISNKTDVDQIELQGRRDGQRRPGLSGFERMKKDFNFSAKTTTFESSQMGATGLLRRSMFSESDYEGESKSWPIIDYNCLEHIVDPVEYFSTYERLENAEKEVQRLNGDSYLTLGKPHSRRNRQHRPGILEPNRKRSMFKFQGMVAAAVDTSSLPNSSNYTEITNSSYSKGVNQIATSGILALESKLVGILALESKLVGNAKIHADSKGDADTNGLEKLMSTCKELDERGIANLVQETLQIKPINVEKLRTPAVSSTAQRNLGSSQICKDAPAIASTSILKRPFSLINPKEDPFFPPNYNKQNGDGCKQTVDSDKMKSNCKDIYDNDIEQSQGGEGGNKIGDSEKLRPNGTDSDNVVAKLGKEILKTKLPLAEKTARPTDYSSISQNANLLMNINGRLAAISKLKRRMLLEKSPGSQHFAFNGDDSRDSSASKSWEKYSPSPIQITCHNGGNQGNQNAQNASIPVFLNGRKLTFEDKIQSPVDETTVKDTNITSMNISEYPKRRLNSLLEMDVAFQRPDRALNKEEFLSSGSEITLEEVGRVSDSVNCEPPKSMVNTHQHFGDPGTSADACFHQLGYPSPAEVNIAIQEEILDVEAAKDDDLPNVMAPLDKDLETAINLLEGRNVEGSDNMTAEY